MDITLLKYKENGYHFIKKYKKVKHNRNGFHLLKTQK